MIAAFSPSRSRRCRLPPVHSLRRLALCQRSVENRRSPQRVVAAVLCLAVLAAPLFVVSASGAQQTGPLDRLGYSPCEEGADDIDLLVMMDASGSLNSPGSGLDPDGSLRRRALERFRAELAGVVRDLPGDAATSVRVSLWRFESGVTQITPFDKASASHPSNEQIGRSLGERSGGRLAYRLNHTNYLQALRAAQDAFAQQSAPDACRLLLFFTDGENDPTGSKTEGTMLAQADELRDVVCRQIKPSFVDAGIDVYTILLGDRFRSAATAGVDGDRDEAAAERITASLQIVRALTGHGDSPVVRGLPPALEFECERWSDEVPQDRTGAIMTIGDLDQLAVQLLEIAEVAARGLIEWTNCGVTTDGETRSGSLPAGRYIESVTAYPRESQIEGYRIRTAGGEVIEGAGSGVEPLRLGSDDMAELEAGWTIEFITDGGGGIDVACYYATTASTAPSVVSGSVTDADGNQPDEVERSPGGLDSAPLEGYRIVAEAPLDLCDHLPEAWPDERVRDVYCNPNGEIVFELQPLECENELRFDKPLVLTYEPAHAEALFRPGELTQEIRIDIDRTLPIRYDCFGAPQLLCASDVDTPSDERDVTKPMAGRRGVDQFVLTITPDTRELPTEPLAGYVDCRLYPPQLGEVVLIAVWRVDPDLGELPGEIDWRFRSDAYGGGAEGDLDDDGMTLRLVAADVSDGVPLAFETTGELSNGDWKAGGVIELTPHWVTGFDDPQLALHAERLMASQRVDLRVDLDYLARTNSALAIWVALLVILLTALVSYLLFCWALWSDASLPDPKNFWAYHGVLPVAAGSSGRLEFGREAAAALNAAQPGRIDGERAGRKRWKRWTAHDASGVRPLDIRLRRAPRLWLPGLLREAWAEVREISPGLSTVAAQPSGRRSPRHTEAASTRARFDRLDVVGSPQRDDEGEMFAPVWAVRPQMFGSAEVSDHELRNLANLLNDASARSSGDAAAGQRSRAAPAAPSGPAEDRPSSSRPAAAPGETRPGGPPPNRFGPPPNSGPGRSV